MAEYFDEESGSWLEEGAYEVVKRRREERKAEAEAAKKAKDEGYLKKYSKVPGMAGFAGAAEAVAGAGTFLAGMAESGINAALGVINEAVSADARGRMGSSMPSETGWQPPKGTIAGDRVLPGGVPLRPEVAEKIDQMRAKGIDVDHLINSGQLWEALKKQEENEKLDAMGYPRAEKLPGTPEPDVVKPPEGTFKEPDAPVVIDGDVAGFLRNPRLAVSERAAEKRREIHGDIQGVLQDTYFLPEDRGGRIAKNIGAAAPIVAGAVVAPQTVIPALAGATIAHEVAAPIGEKLARGAGASDPEAFGEEFGTLASFGPGMAGGHALGSMMAKRYPRQLGGLGWSRRVPYSEGAKGAMTEGGETLPGGVVTREARQVGGLGIREGKGQLPLFDAKGQPMEQVPRIFEVYDKRTGTPLRHFTNENEAMLFVENATRTEPGLAQVGARKAGEAIDRGMEAATDRVAGAAERVGAAAEKAGLRSKKPPEVKVPEDVEARLRREAEREAAKTRPPFLLGPTASAAGYTAGMTTVGGAGGAAAIFSGVPFIGGPLAAMAGNAAGKAGAAASRRFFTSRWRARLAERILRRKRAEYAAGERAAEPGAAEPGKGIQAEANRIALENGGLTDSEVAQYQAMIEMLERQGLERSAAKENAKQWVLDQRKKKGPAEEAGVPENAEQLNLVLDEAAAEVPAKGAGKAGVPETATQGELPGLQGTAGEALKAKTGTGATTATETAPEAAGAATERVEILSGKNKGKTGVVVERKAGGPQDKAGKGKKMGRVKVKLDDGTVVSLSERSTRKVKTEAEAEAPAAETPAAPTAVGEGKAGEALSEVEQLRAENARLKAEAEGKKLGPPPKDTSAKSKAEVIERNGWKINQRARSKVDVLDREGNVVKTFTNKTEAENWAYKESLNPGQAAPKPGTTMEVRSLDDIGENLRGRVEEAYQKDGITAAQAAGEAAGLSKDWAYTLARDVESAALKAEGKPTPKTPTKAAPKPSAEPKVDTIPGLKAKMEADGNKWTVEKQGDKWAVKNGQGKVKTTAETELDAWKAAEKRGRPKSKGAGAKAEPTKKAPEEKAEPDEFGLVPENYAKGEGGKLPVQEKAPGTVGEIDHTPVDSSGFVSYGYKDGVLEVAQAPKGGSAEATVYRYHGVSPEAMAKVEAAVKAKKGVGAALRAATKVENPRTIRRPNRPVGEAKAPDVTEQIKETLSFTDWLEKEKGMSLKKAPSPTSPEYAALMEEYNAWKKGGGKGKTKPTPPEKPTPPKKPAKKGKKAEPTPEEKLGKAVEEVEGPETTLQQDLAEMKGLLKEAKTPSEFADLKGRIKETEKLIADEKKAKAAEKKKAKAAEKKKASTKKKPAPEPEKPAEPSQVRTEGDWIIVDKSGNGDGPFLLMKQGKAKSAKEFRTRAGAEAALDKRIESEAKGRVDKAAGGAGKPTKAKPAGPKEAPADVTMPENAAAIRVAGVGQGLAARGQAGGVYAVVEKSTGKVIESWKGKNAEAAALRFVEERVGEVAPLEPATTPVVEAWRNKLRDAQQQLREAEAGKPRKFSKAEIDGLKLRVKDMEAGLNKELNKGKAVGQGKAGAALKEKPETPVGSKKKPPKPVKPKGSEPTGKAVGEGKAGAALKETKAPEPPAETPKPASPEAAAKAAEWDAQAKAAAEKAKKAKKKKVTLKGDQKILNEEFGYSETVAKEFSDAQAKRLLEAERKAKASQEKAAAAKTKKYKPGDVTPEGRKVLEVDSEGRPTVTSRKPAPDVDKAKVGRERHLPTEVKVTVAGIEEHAPYWKGKVRETKNGFVVELPDATITISPKGKIEMLQKHAEAHGYKSVAEAEAAGAVMEGRTRVWQGAKKAQLDLTNLDAMDHEPFHIFEALFATDKELAVVYRAAEKRAAKSGKSVSEEAAQAFDAYRKADARTRALRQKTALGRFHQRMLDFFNRVRDAVWMNEGGVYRKVMDSKTWEREVRGAKQNGVNLTPGAVAIDAASIRTVGANKAAGLSKAQRMAEEAVKATPRYKSLVESSKADYAAASELVGKGNLSKGQKASVKELKARGRASREAARELIKRETERTDTEINKFFNDLDNVGAMIMRDPARLDYEASEVVKAIKSNSDPQYRWSEDYTTMCKRRYVLQGTIDSIQMKVGDILGPDGVVAVRKALEDSGYEVNCGACYVSSRLVHLATVINKAKNGWVIESGKRKGEFVEPIPKKYHKKLLSQKGRDWLAEHAPEENAKLRKAFAGTQMKIPEARTEYRGEYLNWTKQSVDAVNRMSGTRSQSWSDFEVPHVLDKMESTLHKSIMGIAGHAYTKELHYAEVMKLTNEMVNMSLIPKGSGKTAGLDRNGRLLIDERESFPLKDGLRLRKSHDNMGFEIIGVNDAQIIAAAADPRIDYIIPFHTSGLKAEYLHLGKMRKWADYTKDQHWIDLNTGKALEGKEVSRQIFIGEWQGDLAKLQRLAKARNIKLPFHDRFGFGRPGGPIKGYEKLLTDRRIWGNDGKFVVQKPMEFKFDMPYIRKMMDEYGGLMTDNAVPEIVDVFVKRLKKDGKKEYTLDEMTAIAVEAAEKGIFSTAAPGGRQLTPEQARKMREATERVRALRMKHGGDS